MQTSRAGYRIVGIDPGYAKTGLVVMVNGEYKNHFLIERPTDDSFRNTKDGLYRWAQYNAEIANIYLMDDLQEDEESPVEILAIEGLASYGFQGPRRVNPKYLLQAIFVSGFLIGRMNGMPVKPHGHGSHAPETYPPELIGPNESRALSGKLKHCRSAWDIAMTAYKEITNEKN